MANPAQNPYSGYPQYGSAPPQYVAPQYGGYGAYGQALPQAAPPPPYGESPPYVTASYTRFDDGRVGYSDAYVRQMGSQNPGAQVADQPAVVRNMDDFVEYQKVVPDACLADSAQELMRLIESLDKDDFVVSPEEIKAGLGIICARYNIPIGVAAKPLVLRKFKYSKKMIDDSGSMLRESVVPGKNRWIEVRDRLKREIELRAFLPLPPMIITFLNRSDRIELKRKSGESPADFIQRAHSAINQLFDNPPISGQRTPILKRLQESLEENVDFHLFTDGEPDGIGEGSEAQRLERAKEAIGTLLRRRRNPEMNPITLHSATNTPSDVAWLKQLDEAVPFCNEADNFPREQAEVLKYQGKGFAYTEGLNAVRECVGSACPEDLDKLDEPIPMTKWIKDQIDGVISSVADYNLYFKECIYAQKNCGDGKVAKQAQVWDEHYEEFLRCRGPASELPVVQEYTKIAESA